MSQETGLLMIEVLSEHESKLKELFRSGVIKYYKGFGSEHKYLLNKEQLDVLNEKGIVYDKIKSNF